MVYYFVFDSHTEILDSILYSYPEGTTNKRVLIWDTDIEPRSWTSVSPEEDVADLVVDNFECAFPNFATYSESEAGMGVFQIPEKFDEEDITTAKNNQMDLFRLARNKKLSDSDWTQSSDSPLTDEKKAAWATYRGLLRNLPPSVTNPWIIDWPTQPS